MSLDWTKEERLTLERGIADHGIHTGRCAAFARIAHAVARPRDEGARGIQIRPAPGARFLVPKVSRIPYWGSHTYVETRAHAVDAITGPDGYAAEKFLLDHWEYSSSIRKIEANPAMIDQGIQYLDDEL